jgi:hypothetical protein
MCQKVDRVANDCLLTIECAEGKPLANRRHFLQLVSKCRKDCVTLIRTNVF